MRNQKEKSCCAPKRQEKSEKIPSKLYHRKENHFFEKMVYLHGGTFLMGTNDKEGFLEDREGPVAEQEVSAFYMDKYAVTNAEFQAFVEKTDYKTDAERYGWSFVFHQFISEETKNLISYVQSAPWWYAVEEAYWYQPEGTGSHVENRWDHPVVHISWNDAMAFCRWSGKRLPKEAEWEFAARGGLEQKKYPWGDDFTPNGTHMCNIWQGMFPHTNTQEDGYVGTAPSQSFLQNEYGLYSMSGNVWEWCHNSFFEEEPNGESRAIRGGSYLCHDSYCNRYRLAARSSNTKDSSTGNMGFRCVKDV